MGISLRWLSSLLEEEIAEANQLEIAAKEADPHVRADYLVEASRLVTLCNLVDVICLRLSHDPDFDWREFRRRCFASAPELQHKMIKDYLP